MKPTPPEDSVKVRIANEEFYVSCPEEEQVGLLKAAHYLDNEIKTVQKSGRSMSIEHSAIIVALNLVDEMIVIRENGASVDQSPRIEALSEKIDAFLNKMV